MGYLLTASNCATCEIKKEEASYFLSPKCLGIMHLLADIEEVFMAKYLRRLDSDEAVIIYVINESANMKTALDNLKSTAFDSFLDGIQENDAGNVCLSKTMPTG